MKKLLACFVFFCLAIAASAQHYVLVTSKKNVRQELDTGSDVRIKSRDFRKPVSGKITEITSSTITVAGQKIEIARIIDVGWPGVHPGAMLGIGLGTGLLVAGGAIFADGAEAVVASGINGIIGGGMLASLGAVILLPSVATVTTKYVPHKTTPYSQWKLRAETK